MLNRTFIVSAHVTESIYTTVDAAPLPEDVSALVEYPISAPMLSHVGSSLVTLLSVSAGRGLLGPKTLMFVFPVAVAPVVPLRAGRMSESG